MLFALLLVLLTVDGSNGSADESLLLKHLLDGYDVLERPVVNITDAVSVYLQVIMQQIVDLDEKEQVITINAWLKYSWNDPRLAWEPKEYDNIYDTRLPYGKIWRPDVLLYNSVDSTFDSTYPTNFVLYSDGTINWIPPGIFLISCEIKIKWYPFDEQMCYFKFGSWTYDGTKIDLQPDLSVGVGFDMSEYMVNGEFNLYKTDVQRTEKFYDCCPEPYPDLRFMLFIKRKTLYSAFNFVIPCILITCMTIIGFMLPPDSEITVLLSVSVLLSIVANMVPPTSEAVPLIGVFFITCMIFCSFSLVITTYVLNLHHAGPDMEGVLSPLQKLILLKWLPWLMCMQRPNNLVKRQDLKNPLTVAIYGDADDQLLAKRCPQYVRRQSVANDPDGRRGLADLEARVDKCCKMIAEHSDQFNIWTQAVVMLMHRIFIELRVITKRMREADEASDAENDWKWAAAVVDRLGLVGFTVSVFLATCYIFFTSPYLSAGDDKPFV